jgi:hypothetical protein
MGRLPKPQDLKSLSEMTDQRISKLEREQGIGNLIATIAMGLLEQGVKGVNNTKVELATELILDKYLDLTLADVRYFVKAFIRGDYGKVYGDVDVQTICLAFADFYVDREGVMADKRIAEHRNRVVATMPDVNLDQLYQKHTPKGKTGSVLNIGKLFQDAE